MGSELMSCVALILKHSLRWLKPNPFLSIIINLEKIVIKRIAICKYIHSSFFPANFEYSLKKTSVTFEVFVYTQW
jgi:hypothetical protein